MLSCWPLQTKQLLAEVALLEEEVVHLEEQIVHMRQGMYQNEEHAACLINHKAEGTSWKC